MDLVIKNGTIIDGSGRPKFTADVGIRNDKIVSIGKITVKADRAIDAQGLVVCPGFIDIHSHSEFTLLSNPRAESSIRQGATTLVTGNCGISPVPLKKSFNTRMLEKYIAPLKMTVDLDWGWKSFADYFRRLEKRGIAVNVAPLIGHGALRIAVMGYEDRQPTDDELNQMKELLNEAMNEGAFGLSSGLAYPPGCFADTSELIELCGVVAQYGGIYATHIRNEGRLLVDAVKEAIKIGDKTGVHVEISHLKATGKKNWGKVEEALLEIENAQKRGEDVTFDFYPYTAAMTLLQMLLPNWVHEGGPHEMRKKLRDAHWRRRIVDDIEKNKTEWWNPIKYIDWEEIVVAYSKKHRSFEGKSLLEISKLEGKTPYQTLFDILANRDTVWVLLFMMDERSITKLFKHPLSFVGSDSFSVAPYGPLSVGKPHPRFYGTYPRILQEYVRRRRILTLEEAVKKMTYLPARKIGLNDRGIIQKGYSADIVIFDPRTIKDSATYSDPHQYAEGLEYVIVNGQTEIEKAEPTGTLAGKFLRKNSTTYTSNID